jgi:hypothetical protein
MFIFMFIQLLFALENKDLKSLFKAKKYDQVIQKATKIKDLDEKDSDLVLKSILLKTKKLNCEKTYLSLEKDQKKIKAFKDHEKLNDALIKAGECDLKKNKFKNEKMVLKLLKKRNSLITNFVINGYDDKKDKLSDYLLLDEAIPPSKKLANLYFLKKRENPLTKKEIEVFKKFQWTDRYLLDAEKDIKKIQSEQLKSLKIELSKETKNIISNLKNLEKMDTLVLAEYLGLLWFSSTKTHSFVNPFFDIIKPGQWLEVERKLLSLKTKKSFWFQGKGWGHEEVVFKIRSYFSLVVKMIKTECNNQEFVKLNKETCQQLNKI